MMKYIKKTEASSSFKMPKRFFLFAALSLVLFTAYSSYVYAGNNRVKQSQEHVYAYDDDDEGYENEDGYHGKKVKEYRGEDDDYSQQNEHAVRKANKLNSSAQHTKVQNTIPSGKAVHFQLSGLAKSIQVTPIIRNGQTLVAAEKVLPYMNILFVKYEKGTLLEMYAERDHLIFHTNKKVVYKNGKKYLIPAEPIVQKGIYYVPLSMLTKGLGYKMEWNPKTETILVRKGG